MRSLRKYTARHKTSAFRPRKQTMWLPLTKPDTSWFWTNPVHDAATCCVHCSLTQPRRTR